MVPAEKDSILSRFSGKADNAHDWTMYFRAVIAKAKSKSKLRWAEIAKFRGQTALSYRSAYLLLLNITPTEPSFCVIEFIWNRGCTLLPRSIYAWLLFGDSPMRRLTPAC
jgi:hypothetical protein